MVKFSLIKTNHDDDSDDDDDEIDDDDYDKTHTQVLYLRSFNLNKWHSFVSSPVPVYGLIMSSYLK